MSRMAEMAVYQEEQDNLSGMDDCEYQEFLKKQSDLFKDMGIEEGTLDKLNKLGGSK